MNRIIELGCLLERLIGLLAGLSMVMCLLTGCQPASSELPEGFDEERVEEEARRSIGYFNEKDYQSILNMGCREFQEVMTEEEFAEQCDPMREKRGTFREIIKTVFYGVKDQKDGKEYGGAVLVGDYEEGRISFYITFDEDMKLAEWMIR